jgi:hypothetical protein
MLYQLLELPPEYIRVIQRLDEMRLRLRFLLQQQPTRWTRLLRRSQLARAIQGSNSIEGYNVTVDDAVAAVEGEQPLIVPTTGRLRPCCADRKRQAGYGRNSRRRFTGAACSNV